MFRDVRVVYINFLYWNLKTFLLMSQFHHTLKTFSPSPLQNNTGCKTGSGFCYYNDYLKPVVIWTDSKQQTAEDTDGNIIKMNVILSLTHSFLYFLLDWENLWVCHHFPKGFAVHAGRFLCCNILLILILTDTHICVQYNWFQCSSSGFQLLAQGHKNYGSLLIFLLSDFTEEWKQRTSIYY